MVTLLEKYSKQDIRNLLNKLEDITYKQSDIITSLSNLLSESKISELKESEDFPEYKKDILDDIQHILNYAGQLSTDAKYIKKLLRSREQ